MVGLPSILLYIYTTYVPISWLDEIIFANGGIRSYQKNIVLKKRYSSTNIFFVFSIKTTQI